MLEGFGTAIQVIGRFLLGALRFVSRCRDVLFDLIRRRFIRRRAAFYLLCEVGSMSLKF